MQLISIDGNTQKLDGGAMFGHAPKALWSNWVSVDEQNRIDMACRCLLLIRDNGQKILFETGVGNFFAPELKARYGIQENSHRLLDNLATIGIAHTDIDYVVLSHLHFDHAGGLLASWQADQPLQLLFNNAQILVGRTQWQHAQHPHIRDQASFIPELNRLLAESGRLLLIDKNSESPFDDIRFHFSDGHTPGLMLSEISTNDGALLFASDLIPGSAWMHLPIYMGYDRFAEQLIDEKMPCGRVRQDSRQRYYAEACIL